MIADSLQIARLGSKIVDFILPPRCVMTGEIVAGQGTLSPMAWQTLRFITRPFCARCGYPFEFELESEGECGPCLADPPPFATARAALAYDEASRDLILKFKHADRLEIVPTLIPMLERAGGEAISVADIIVPVPLHRWRLFRRRYNQAALLAIGLSRRVGKPAIPDVLIRTRQTVSQGPMKAAERAKNVRKAFAVHPAHDVRGKTVLLIDDVYTTGATVRECADALLAGGAAAVHVLVIARVVRTR